jgi:hypothetical protein
LAKTFVAPTVIAAPVTSTLATVKPPLAAAAVAAFKPNVLSAHELNLLFRLILN